MGLPIFLINARNHPPFDNSDSRLAHNQSSERWKQERENVIGWCAAFCGLAKAHVVVDSSATIVMEIWWRLQYSSTMISLASRLIAKGRMSSGIFS